MFTGIFYPRKKALMDGQESRKASIMNSVIGAKTFFQNKRDF
jgi:hypothetical protein